MKLKIMSFNIRCKNGGDGINEFENREPKVLEAIRNEAPDLIGFQEVTDVQRDFLSKNLSNDYILLGCGRRQNYYGEGVSIAFKRDLFELVSFETFWLSDTPDLPGSRYESSDQSTCCRLTVHAELIAKELSAPIHFFNTHLDHQGPGARLLGMRDIIKKIANIKGCYALTGDFNALPNSPEITEILNAEKICAHDATSNLTHTFHGFGKFDRDYKIDYIFTNCPSGDSYIVEANTDDGIYISDHHPICAKIEF
jgi:endonuclease/exonuclease/phosphatase family metal-dependent hydrolase